MTEESASEKNGNYNLHIVCLSMCVRPVIYFTKPENKNKNILRMIVVCCTCTTGKKKHQNVDSNHYSFCLHHHVLTHDNSVHTIKRMG